MILRMGGGGRWCIGMHGSGLAGLQNRLLVGKLDSELFAEFVLGMTGMISFMLLG